MKRMMRSLLASTGLATMLAGCSSSGDYAPGELGNGGFYFSCDDAVSCAQFSDDAAKFPKAVSSGSTFAVRFVPNGNQGVQIHFNDASPDRGVVIQSVGEFITKGPKGLTAVKPGYASIVARDAQGFVIDYTVMRVAKPDALVVYAADGARVDPPRVDQVDLVTGERRAYRAFAQEKKENLAGSLQVEWRSSDPSVIALESTTNGTAMVVAKKAGNAMLTASGGTFQQAVPVVVK